MSPFQTPLLVGTSSLSLDELKEKFAVWRESSPRPRKIPVELWEDAVSLARVFSVSKVSRSLGLDHPALKQKVASKNPEAKHFVELKLAHPNPGPKLSPLAEIISPHGMVLRLFSESDQIIRTFLTT